MAELENRISAYTPVHVAVILPCHPRALPFLPALHFVPSLKINEKLPDLKFEVLLPHLLLVNVKKSSKVVDVFAVPISHFLCLETVSIIMQLVRDFVLVDMQTFKLQNYKAIIHMIKSGCVQAGVNRGIIDLGQLQRLTSSNMDGGWARKNGAQSSTPWKNSWQTHGIQTKA